MMKSYHSLSSSWCWLLFPEEWCDVIVRCCFWNDSYKSVFFEGRLEWKLFSQNLSKFASKSVALETTQNCASFIQYYISLIIIIIFMEASTTTSASKTPADFLKSIRGKRVVVKLNSGVDYRGILIEWMNFAVSQGRRKKEIVRSFVRLLLYFYTTTLVHINRGVVRDIDTSSSSSSSFWKTGILACLDGYMNIAMEHTEVRTVCRLFS